EIYPLSLHDALPISAQVALPACRLRLPVVPRPRGRAASVLAHWRICTDAERRSRRRLCVFRRIAGAFAPLSCVEAVAITALSRRSEEHTSELQSLAY